MTWLTDRRLLTGALIAWGVIALLGLVFGPTLGHDESAFALVAQGRGPLGSWLYRSDGTVLLARIGLALGGAEWQLRLASVVVNALVPLAVYALGRVVFTARTGAWAAAVLAGAHPMAFRSAELLSDLPSTACVLGGLALVIHELERPDGPSWRVVAAAPVFAAAFYMRYGSAPVIALALAVAGLLWWRQVLRRMIRALAMVVALAVLLIPHLVRSLHATGTMLGILHISAGMPRRAYVGEGLVTYLTSNPLTFYGALVAPVMVAGAVSLFSIRRKAPWYLAIVAAAQVVSLGIESHGQPRYVFIATSLLVILGVDALAHARFARPREAFALVAASWLSMAIATPIYCWYVNDARAPIVDAGRVLRAHSEGRPCVAVALIVPQLSWYSGCEVIPSEKVVSVPADRDRYAVSFTRWPAPLGPVLDAVHLQATPLATEDRRAQVWLLH